MIKSLTISKFSALDCLFALVSLIFWVPGESPSWDITTFPKWLRKSAKSLLYKTKKTQKFWAGWSLCSGLLKTLCLHSGTLLDQRFKGYNLKIHLAGDWCAINAMQCNQHIRCFFFGCLNMDNGSSSCVKVLYSACDSVSAFNEVVSSNWDRSPQMVPT